MNRCDGMWSSAVLVALGLAAVGIGPRDVFAAQYSYDDASQYGPSRWASVTIDGAQPFAACSATRQSPVSFEFSPDFGSSFAGLSAPDFTSGARIPQVIDIVNDGATISLEFGADQRYSTMRDPTGSSSVEYRLARIEIHSPSEHALSGSRLDAELQFHYHAPQGVVAASPEALVFDVLVRASSYGANLELQKLFDMGQWPVVRNLPVPSTATASRRLEQDTNGAVVFTPERLLPSLPDYVTYLGRETRPPCSSGRRHFVMLQPVSMSFAQLAFLRSIVGLSAPNITGSPTAASRWATGNARPTQSLAAREVRLYRDVGNVDEFDVPETGTATSDTGMTFAIVALIMTGAGCAALGLAFSGILKMFARLSDSVTEVGANAAGGGSGGQAVPAADSVAAIAAAAETKKNV